MLPFYRWFQKRNTNQRGKWIRTMREELHERSTLLLIYIDIERLTQVELAYGEVMSRRFIQIVEKLIVSISSEWFQNKAKVIAIEPLWADDFAIYLSKRGGVEPQQIEQWCLQFKELLINTLQRDFSHLPLIGLHMGYAHLQGKDLTKEIYRGIRDAQQMAKYGMNTKEYQYLHQFREILVQENIHMLYQPIVSLKTGKPFGWEALARGPENSFFHVPANLFKYAEETKNTFQMESICRRKAFEQLEHVEPHEKLFINLDPRSIEDPE
ncbi:EAL domain-containing protein [Ammoniphilus sp. 3BR4]|uniref:EAL domain-containing protein n=1 Tax=Ammoniphilus sp. 3BR4 TaxID=3158265 RepID=UPI00346780F7